MPREAGDHIVNGLALVSAATAYPAPTSSSGWFGSKQVPIDRDAANREDDALNSFDWSSMRLRHD